MIALRHGLKFYVTYEKLRAARVGATLFNAREIKCCPLVDNCKKKMPTYETEQFSQNNI